MDDRLSDYGTVDNYSESLDDMLEGTRSYPLKAWVRHKPFSVDKDITAMSSKRKGIGDEDNEESSSGADMHIDTRQTYDSSLLQPTKKTDDWIMISRREEI